MVGTRISALRRGLVLAIAGAALSAGCAGAGAGREDDSASCSGDVLWNGSYYYGVARSFPYGRRAGTGTTSSCGEHDGPDSVTVFRLRGVDPTLAIGVKGRRGRVYLARGFFVELESHPLHGELLGKGERPRRCRRTFKRSGTVKAVTELFVTTPQGEIAVRLHPNTRITGFLRAGVPYLHVGDRITITGRECAERTLWADDIRPTG